MDLMTDSHHILRLIFEMLTSLMLEERVAESFTTFPGLGLDVLLYVTKGEKW